MNRLITWRGTLLAIAILALSCSQARPLAVQPDAAILKAPARLEVGPREPQSEVPEEAPQSKPYGEKLIVIEEGGGPVKRTLTLVEAAQKERLRRQDAEKSEIVITDENLAAFATGELTYTDESFTQDSDQDSLGVSGIESLLLLQENEDKWRARMLELRLQLRDRASSIKDLESQVAQWRQRFYLEEDDYHRDTQVKPAWDRALEQLNSAREEVTAIERRLDAAQDEGRLSGVPPGWLREGIEFEPQDDPVEEVYLDPGEPVILDESNW